MGRRPPSQAEVAGTVLGENLHELLGLSNVPDAFHLKCRCLGPTRSTGGSSPAQEPLPFPDIALSLMTLNRYILFERGFHVSSP